MKNRLLAKTGIKNPEEFDWLSYMEENSHSRKKLKFDDLEPISRADRALIAPSMRAFALGEASEGRHLTACAVAYSITGDWKAYPRIIEYFIKEENYHSKLLQLYMASYQIRPGVNSGLDNVFRFLRKQGGLEGEAAVLVTAEIVALSYYRALARVTNSSLLKDICDQMLHDELYHVVLQSYTLGRINAERGEDARERQRGQRRLLMRGTAAAVWDRYDSLFITAGYTRGRFVASCMRTLEESIEIEKMQQK